MRAKQWWLLLPFFLLLLTSCVPWSDATDPRPRDEILWTRATRAIEKQLQYLDEFKKWGETVKCNGEKIADRAERMKKELLTEVEALDREVSALKVGVERAESGGD
jgi:DNA-binding PucR family transcriptional regulator